MASSPPLGFIIPELRTKDQHEAHERAEAAMPKFANLQSAAELLKTLDVPKGTKVMLTDTWRAPECIADMGQEFTGFGQYTGSCVGVSEGNVVTTATCVQRLIGDTPTLAEVCFWPLPYGMTRLNEGDRGQGEGAVDSVMGETLRTGGYFGWNDVAGLPSLKMGPDGFWLVGGKQMEFKWSDGSKIDPALIAKARERAGMLKVSVQQAEEELAAIINGYPVLSGCSLYVGNGQIVSRANGNSYVRGKYDSRGGHSTARLGAWLHPDDGWLIGYSNQWPSDTYPKDPAGLGRCCVWLPIAEEQKMLASYGGGNGETMILSKVPGTPAQPKLLDWATAFSP